MEGIKQPLSQLTLGDADSFLESLICSTQGSGVSDLNRERGEDVSEEDMALQAADKAESIHGKYTTAHGAMTTIMSKFEFGSAVAKLETVAEIDPEAVMTATCVVLSAASDVASMKVPDLTMQQVLAALKRIEGKLDQMLTTPLNKALDYYKNVINAVLTENFKLAFEKLPLLMDNATTAFHYANKKDIGIESFRECCKATRLLIFATILHASFDREKEVFLPPDKLPKNSIDYILRELEDIISRSSDQSKNVKLTAYLIITVVRKTEVRDLLDSILKMAYPFISQGRKLTDINKQLTCSRSGSGLKFSLLPEFLPMGYEDKTTLIIGTMTNEQRAKDVVKINVWKNGKRVYYEHKKAIFYKAIDSESDPVDMEDAWPFTSCPVSKITITDNSSKTALSVGMHVAAIYDPFSSGVDPFGNYRLNYEEKNGRPVYACGLQRDMFLLQCQEDGTWVVYDNHSLLKRLCLKSRNAALCPALCKEWEYSRAKILPWTKCDITISCHYHSQESKK